MQRDVAVAARLQGFDLRFCPRFRSNFNPRRRAYLAPGICEHLAGHLGCARVRLDDQQWFFFFGKSAQKGLNQPLWIFALLPFEDTEKEKILFRDA